MTNSYKFRNGLLLLGAAPLNITAQMRSVIVTPKEEVKSTDAVPYLDNTELAGEDEVEVKFTLGGKLTQDLAAAGIIDWSWDHDGNTEEDFMFIPDITFARGVSGICYPTPLIIGGEVTKPANRPDSDFEWRIKGTPVFGVHNPGGVGVADDTVTEDA